MPVCQRCGAENADHMLACWRCVGPLYPPHIADEIARKRAEIKLQPLPPPQQETVGTIETAEVKTEELSEAPTITTVAPEEAVTEGIITEETITEGVTAPTEPAPTVQISGAPTESVAPPIEKKPPAEAVKVEAPPKERPIGRLLKRFAKVLIIVVPLALIVVCAVVLLPRLLEKPEKVVDKFLSTAKAGNIEEAKTFLDEKSRAEIEKQGSALLFTPLKNVDYEIGETSIQGSEASVKVKLKVTSPIKLEFEAPFVCVREKLSWKIDAERTTKEVVNAAISAASQQLGSMLMEALKKGFTPPMPSFPQK